MAELTTLARPYAKAAFEFALKNNQLSQWSDMLRLLANVSQADSVDTLLTTPAKTVDAKADAIIDICQEQLNDNGCNFVRSLAANNRLALMPEIYSIFEQLKANQEKSIDVDVVTAHELSEATYNKLTQALTGQLSCEIKVNSSVDPNLLGGVVVRAGDLVIDGSVRGKLAKLSETLNS